MTLRADQSPWPPPTTSPSLPPAFCVVIPLAATLFVLSFSDLRPDSLDELSRRVAVFVGLDRARFFIGWKNLFPSRPSLRPFPWLFFITFRDPDRRGRSNRGAFFFFCALFWSIACICPFCPDEFLGTRRPLQECLCFFVSVYPPHGWNFQASFVGTVGMPPTIFLRRVVAPPRNFPPILSRS